jgi:hypothetical protein
MLLETNTQQECKTVRLCTICNTHSCQINNKNDNKVLTLKQYASMSSEYLSG